MKWLIRISIGFLVAGIITVATDFWFLWLPIAHSPEYPGKIAALFMAATALVTLILALTTVKAIEQSNLREQKRREDAIKKEKRDKEDLQLNEVIKWALDISTRTSPPNILDNPEWILESKYDEDEKIKLAQISSYMDLVNQYTVMKLYGEVYISRIAYIIRKDLGKTVAQLLKKTKAHIDVLFKASQNSLGIKEYRTLMDVATGKIKLSEDDLSKALKSQLEVFYDRLALNKSATKVIEIALEIKIQDIS